MLTEFGYTVQRKSLGGGYFCLLPLCTDLDVALKANRPLNFLKLQGGIYKTVERSE